jgi:type IV pilus assembly protein PilM
MLGFVKSMFAPKPGPIGVDFGTDTLRLAQCLHDGRDWHLVAAACTDVPAGVRSTPEALGEFTVEALRELLSQGGFRGRDAVLCVPSNELIIQHIRMPKLDDADTRKALPWEVKGKLPIDANTAVLRHMIAGEVQVNNEPKNEVVVMATPKNTVSGLLQIASRAKLNVMGMNVEPKSVIDCFSHVYRRRSDQDVTSCYIDIGAKSTRVTIARGTQILFARSISIGGDHLSQAVAEQLGMDFEQAKLLRIKLAATPIARPEPVVAPAPHPADEVEPPSENHSFALLGLAPREDRRHESERVAIVAPTLPTDLAEQQRRVDTACSNMLQQLCDELNLCRRYCEATFAQFPVDRIVFIGGEARQRTMCQQIAQNLGLAAQLGDPLVRMGKTTEVGPECGIDPRQPQPAWAVALGLTMGPLAAEAPIAKSA